MDLFEIHPSIQWLVHFLDVGAAHYLNEHMVGRLCQVFVQLGQPTGMHLSFCKLGGVNSLVVDDIFHVGVRQVTTPLLGCQQFLTWK